MTLLLAGLMLIAFGLWCLGGNEPVFAFSGAKSVWFVALKQAGPGSSTPAACPAGVSVKWIANSDFPFIGAGEPYWDRFMLVTASAGRVFPVELTRDAEDAFVARLQRVLPPRLLLGLMRALLTLGIWKMPQGEILADAGLLDYRAEVMPARDTIQTLLSQPSSYRPAMVNFLRFHTTARYPGAEPAVAVDGRTAYRRYGRVALQCVYRVGGRMVFFGNVTQIVKHASSGPMIGEWHAVAVMLYPEPRAILAMEQFPNYRAALHHRDAGLEKTFVIASSM